jgi:hypothetical protein
MWKGHLLAHIRRTRTSWIRLSNSTRGFSKSNTAVAEGACLIGPKSASISANQSLPGPVSGARRPVSRARRPTSLWLSDGRARANLRVKHRLDEEQSFLGMLMNQSSRYSKFGIDNVRCIVRYEGELETAHFWTVLASDSHSSTLSCLQTNVNSVCSNIADKRLIPQLPSDRVLYPLAHVFLDGAHCLRGQLYRTCHNCAQLCSMRHASPAWTF